MADRLRIDAASVTVFGGPAYEIVDPEDGPSARFDYFVGVTAGGQDYVHPAAFRHQYDAERRLADRVIAAGDIDPALWGRQDPRMALEDRFDLYAEREQEVRVGLRPEWDMYHGID